MSDAAKPGVLHIDTERTWRGGQQQAAWLIEGLLARGWPTALVCPRGPRCSRSAATPAGGRCTNRHARRAGHRRRRANRPGSRAPRGLAILHAHSSHALALGLWARLFDRRLRLVASRRVDFPVGGNFLSRLKYSTGALDRIVCISAAIRDQLVADGVPPGKLVVIPSGVDTRRFAGVRPPPGFRRSLGIPNGHLVIGTVAALADHKDYPNLLRAARLVLDRAPDTTFVAVGDGPLNAQVAALARELGLGRRFLLMGFREDVGSFLKSFDIFVLASKTEGMGTSILDAQALGLPVVACRAGGMPEIVADRETGLLVPTGDPAALAAALLEAIGDPELRAALGARARKAAAEHDIGRTVAAHEQLYRELVAPASAERPPGDRP